MLSFTIPEGYELTFKEYLFNTEKHRLTQVITGWISYYWLDVKAKAVVASFHCFLKTNEVYSPYKATFGGIDFDKNISLKSLTEFISQIGNNLKEKSIFNLQVTLAPQNYNSCKFILQFQALYDNGFQVANSEAVSAIEVNNSSFFDNIHKSERKKLKRAKEANFEFKILSEDSYEEIYHLIDHCRKERGIKISMSKMDLERFIKNMPDRFLYYGIYDDKQLISAAICIKVCVDIIYVFYGGHLKEYNKLSPAVMLYEGVYDDCYANGFKLLDFGTSPDRKGTNFKLLDFKQYLGAKLGLKITFIRTFND